MKNLWLVIMGFAVVAIGMSSCGGSENMDESAINLVPETSTIVVGFDIKSMMNKADMDAMKEMDFYQDMLAEAAADMGESMAKVIENPEMSGVDLEKNAYFFMDVKGEDDVLVGIAFRIADKANFEKLVNEMEVSIKKGKGFQYAMEDEEIVAWNDTDGFFGSIVGDYENGETAEDVLSSIFSKNASIVENRDAAKALNGKHDIKYYFSSETLVYLFGEELEMSELFISKNDLKNNSFTGYTDFNDGELITKMDIELSEGLKSDLKMIFAEGSTTDFSKYIPKKDLGMLMTGKINFAGINQLLKDKNVSGMANNRLNAAGLNTDDIANAIDGDMAFALNMKEGRGEPHVMMMLQLGDRKAFGDILNKMEALGLVQQESDNAYIVGNYSTPSAKMIIDGDMLIFSNNLEHIAKIENGGLSKSETVSKAIYKKAGGVLGLYVDYANAMSLNRLIMGTIGDFSGGMETMEMSIGWKESLYKTTMKDKSKNALRALIENMNESYKEANDYDYDFETEVEAVEEEAWEEVPEQEEAWEEEWEEE